MTRARNTTGLLLTLLVLTSLPVGAQSLFWENPRIDVSAGVRFLSAAEGGGLLAVMWQEMDEGGAGGGRIYLSVRTSRNARVWRESRRFFGPITYEDRAVPLYSMAMDSLGNLYVAVATGETETVILRSTDQGQSFETLANLQSVRTSLAPILFVSGRGALLLFVTQESGENLAVHYALSEDGRRWSDFDLLVKDPNLPINFRPFHASQNGREYVVFQALATEGRLGELGRRGVLPYQLYSVTSGDGGSSWSAPVALAFAESVDGQKWQSDLFINQRPFVLPLGDRLAVVWERQFQSDPIQIYYAELDEQGKYLGPAEPVTRSDASNYFPRLVALHDRLWLFWFDNTDGLFYAERRSGFWRSEELEGITGASLFPYPVLLDEQLYVFWENRVSGTSRLVALQPDQSVEPPELQAVDFNPRQPSRRTTVQVRWTLPRDSSGMRGVGYVWGQDPDAPVPRELKAASDTNRSPLLDTDRDGTWYFRVAAQDRAGNWSAPTTISFVRDTEPPDRPLLDSPPEDSEGFLVTNTFEMRWTSPGREADLAGYAYTLTYLGSDAVPEVLPDPTLPRRVETTATAIGYRNRDNGVWLFAVAALDQAGNISRPSTALLRLNKYIPVTYIAYVNAETDPLGGVSLAIGGRGFSVGGRVREVILDRDGQAPYEYTFRASDAAFAVASDRLIRNLTVTDIKEGAYRVGVRHPVRGLAWSPSALSFESAGTVKYGDFSYTYPGRWQSARRGLLSIGAGGLALWVLAGFLAVLLVVSARKMVALAEETRLLRRDVLAVLRGEVPLIRKEEIMAELKRRGAGLTLKFTLVVVALILITVLMVSIALGVYMTGRQRVNLTEGLRQRAEVVLGGLATGAENNLPIKNTIELGLLPDQARSMEEATFVTVTGGGVEDEAAFDYVWATNDPEIGGKVSGGSFSPALAGEVRILDDLSPILQELADTINREAQQRVSGLAEEANRLTAEAREVALREGIDSPRVQELQSALNEVNAQISVALRELKARTGSVPVFDSQEILPFYTFYRPLVYRRRGENVYYRGAVRLGISTDMIQTELRRLTVQLLARTTIIALIAAGLGVAGAIVMASITVKPIRKLAAGVAVIRDTENKEELKGHVIDVRSRDEIGFLATTVNQMTQGLAAAAAANKQLMIGKEVQKMFIPLAVDGSGRKGTTGGEETEQLEIFGFYEGARGVSGDYFDYRKLDDKRYAAIKCDISGKGISASLLMIEVATIFSTYFRNWTPREPGLKLEPLAYLINDMLEEKGFRGLFAAFTLAIINAETGKVYLCNAGDTKLHVFRAASRTMAEYNLPTAPAAGPIASELVRMQGGFKQVAYELKQGDILFLFTDGIEEASRVLRDPDFRPRPCDEEACQKEAESQGVILAENNTKEQLGLHRIYEIVNAVFNRRKFELVKFRNPTKGENLSFDFSTCHGRPREAVLALVAVEKLFRLIPDPAATAEDRVQLDRGIDAFLREHFLQYDRYFGHRIESQASGEDVTFTHLKEDEQFDDLTILLVRKK